jgi:hypothetical protein
MKAHATDVLALCFGLAFGALGGAFLARELTDRELDGAWVSAFVFMALGVVALAVTLLQRPRPGGGGSP